MKEFRPIICVDFDGVIHSYKSGWKGPRNIPDPPVAGAIEWLMMMESADTGAPHWKRRFDVCIYSSRSRYLLGRLAMKRWLFKYHMPPDTLDGIRFPLMKPPAHIQIDDRAFLFEGAFPSIAVIEQFKPWNKKHHKANK